MNSFCQPSTSSLPPRSTQKSSPAGKSMRRRRQAMTAFTPVVALCSLLLLALAPLDVEAAQNITSLTGTWASGSGHVMTGLGFFNPISKNFSMPQSGGTAYSFVEDLPNGGHFETSTFTFNSNPSNNRCFTAVMTWQHGTFVNNVRNQSLSLTPFPEDGVVQVLDPCGATSVAQYSYNEFELIPYWYNYVESDTGFANLEGGSAFAIQLYDNGGNGATGAPKSKMFLVNRPPTMLPTEQLHTQVLNSVGADAS